MVEKKMDEISNPPPRWMKRRWTEHKTHHLDG
jgi:hypothetical protein